MYCKKLNTLTFGESYFSDLPLNQNYHTQCILWPLPWGFHLYNKVVLIQIQCIGFMSWFLYPHRYCLWHNLPFVILLIRITIYNILFVIIYEGVISIQTISKTITSKYSFHKSIIITDTLLNVRVPWFFRNEIMNGGAQYDLTLPTENIEI